jgi:ribosomal protein S12 methylthiotransferase accessory factor
VVVRGVAIASPSWAVLADALGPSVRLFADIPRGAITLAVGIYLHGAEREQDLFGLWARARQLPALTVRAEADELVIGPLALPGKSGCGYCARARMAAAFASNGKRPLTQSHLRDVDAVAFPLLSAEIRAIMHNGISAASLLDRVLVCDLKTGLASRHRVIPLSWCPVCGGASGCVESVEAESNLSVFRDPESLLRELEGWVDPHTGIISEIQFELPEDGKDVPIIATTSPPHLLCDDGSLRQLPIGWGKGMNLSEAILSAVGEAIERYSGSLLDPARVIWKKCDELEGDFLDPREFALYSEAQYSNADYPFARFDPQIAHPWILGSWGHDGSPVWVPAILVYLFFSGGPDHFFAQGTSNGLAASSTARDAGLRALLELVERDAFMTAWLTGGCGERIVLDETLDGELSQVLESVERLGASVELYALPDCAVGTAVLCLALGDGVEYPGVTIGLSADLDPRRAVRQAILELAQTGPHLRRMMVSGRLQVPENPQDVREMLDHAAYYFPANRIEAFGRIRHNGATLRLRDLLQRETTLERSLESCASALWSAGIRVAIVDVTSPDLLIGPFRVVRAVSPDLQPISCGYGLDSEPVRRVRLRGIFPEIPPVHPIW